MCFAVHLLPCVCIISIGVLWMHWCGGESGSEPHSLLHSHLSHHNSCFLFCHLTSATHLFGLTKEKKDKCLTERSRPTTYLWQKQECRWQADKTPSCSTLTYLACVTLYWCMQTRVSNPTSLQHAPHSAATWHDTPTATVGSLSDSCQFSGQSKHTKKLNSIYAMLCLFCSRHLKIRGNGVVVAVRVWGRCLKRTPPLPLGE